MNWNNLPNNWGYHWIKKLDDKIEMVHLVPAKYYKETGEIEAWNCPGIGRYRLNINNMPIWQWKEIKI